MNTLPKISILTKFLEDQRKILKERAKNGNRKFTDVRKSVLNNDLFISLKTDTGFKLTFHNGYLFDILQAKSIYQFYKVLENIQLNHTARMSGRAIANMF